MKRGFRHFFLVLLSTFFPVYTHANILKLDQVDGLISYFATMPDASALVILKIDNVLLIPQDTTFRLPTLKRYAQMYQSMTRSLTQVEQDILQMYMLIDSPLVPLEEKMLGLIKYLRDRRIPVLALTQSLTGTIDRIDSCALWRVFSLNYAGINLSWSFPHLATFVTFPHFHKYLGSYPAFCRGVLLTNGQNESQVLMYFLEKMVTLPKQLIIVDAQEENLIALEASITQRFPRLQFTGIYFTAAHHSPVESVSLKHFQSTLEATIQQTKVNKNF